ncbi:hypothetical protein C8R45DRAFT_933174 [Mycena sanguinolenta]|nr:hypothetical protein C8R45DRAFT_933174 [Mycena sanguinolenta]
MDVDSGDEDSAEPLLVAQAWFEAALIKIETLNKSLMSNTDILYRNSLLIATGVIVGVSMILTALFIVAGAAAFIYHRRQRRIGIIESQIVSPFLRITSGPPTGSICLSKKEQLAASAGTHASAAKAWNRNAGEREGANPSDSDGVQAPETDDQNISILRTQVAQLEVQLQALVLNAPPDYTEA